MNIDKLSYFQQSENPFRKEHVMKSSFRNNTNDIKTIAINVIIDRNDCVLFFTLFTLQMSMY